MQTVFLKKHTEGGTAGLFWEAGEVQEVNSYLADELVKLSPSDFEIVQEGESAPEIPENNEEDAEPEESSTEPVIEVSDKPKRPYNKKASQTTESSSAE